MSVCPDIYVYRFMILYVSTACTIWCYVVRPTRGEQTCGGSHECSPSPLEPCQHDIPPRQSPLGHLPGSNTSAMTRCTWECLCLEHGILKHNYMCFLSKTGEKKRCHGLVFQLPFLPHFCLLYSCWSKHCCCC